MSCQPEDKRSRDWKSQNLEGHLPHSLLSRMILPVRHDQNNLGDKIPDMPMRKFLDWVQ